MTHDANVAGAGTLERARRGDSDALADLWVTYQPQLMRLLGRHGRSIAEDIASQVWIDVGRSIERFEGDADAFRSWIFTIAGRRAIDEMRRASHRREFASASVTSLADARRTDDQLGESLDGVLALLATLQPVAAEVVLLRVVHDLPAAEVAAITGVSESNVRVMAHRALDRLRQTLENAAVGTGTAAPTPRLA